MTVASVPVSAVEQPAEEKPSGSRRSDAKMRLHICMLGLTGVMTMLMLHLHLDQTNTALFSFGPLGPSIITEVVDFIKDL